MSAPDTRNIHRPRAGGNAITGEGATPPFFQTSNHTTPDLNGPENANGEAVLAAPGSKTPPEAGLAPDGQVAGGSPDTPVWELPAGAAGGFLTANGARDSHAVVLSGGRINRSPRAGTPYRRMSWAEIVALATTPAAVPKNEAPFIIPSTYAEADGRHHDTQRERGTFWLLAVDIDTGNPSLDDVVAAVRAVVGDARALIYSSAGATAAKRKWRVLVPLATPVAGADYHDTQLALFGLLEAAGVACDVALARPGQPVYMPNVPPDKRGPDGRPVWFHSVHRPGPVLELAGHAIVKRREAMRAQRAAEAAQRAERAAAFEAERLAHVQATGDTFNVVEHFNANHSVASLLARYGFDRGHGNHWRHPETKTGSFATEDRGNHWVCLSAWAHNDNAGQVSRNGHRFGDAFDLFVAFEHGGNRTAAFTDYARAVRPARPVVDAGQVVELQAPPARVEEIHTPPVVPVAEIQDAVAGQIARVLEERPALAVITAGTAAGKTTAAVRLGAARPDRIVWNVGSHAAATAVVVAHKAIGHDDVAAMPPRDETTCRCWTKHDVDVVAAGHKVKPFPSMQAALRVGSPITACARCPLRPGAKSNAVVAVADVALSAFAPVDDALLEAAYADPFNNEDAHHALATAVADATPDIPEAGTCEYWRRVAEAEAARITVQCQQRTERRPQTLAPKLHEDVTVFTDEHALAVVNPRRSFIPEDFDAVATVLLAAAANERAIVSRRHHGSHEAWKRAHEIPDWAEAIAGVATAVATFTRDAAAAGQRAVLELPADLAVNMPTAPHKATQRLLAMVANEELTKAFDAEAFTFIRKVANGGGINAKVAVSENAAGGHHASVHWSWRLDMPPGVCHVALDATVDRAALKAVAPDAVVLDPPGAAPMVHDARQWWHEINGRTHPAVVLDWIEAAINAMGWLAVALIMTKRHRRVLFPQTRPRGNAPAMDKPVDLEAIAGWNVDKGALSAEAWERRMADARKVADRVAVLRARLAKDAHGNAVVDHHRGTRSRGSNAFMAANGVDQLVVLGQQRANQQAMCAELLAKGADDAVVAGSRWDDIGATLPHVDGTTRDVRYRGYVCPVWAGAALAINRAELVQTIARARANLAGGVPVVVIAAEPCGLPLADPPARLPAGVAAVVEAVRVAAAEVAKSFTHVNDLVAAAEVAKSTSQAVLANADQSQHLPQSYQTLYELTQLDDDDTVEGMKRGEVPLVDLLDKAKQLAAGESCHRAIGAEADTGVVPGGNLGGVGDGVADVQGQVLCATRLKDTPGLYSYRPVAHRNGVALADVLAGVSAPARSVQRWLVEAVAMGALVREGTGRWTRYRLPTPVDAVAGPPPAAPSLAMATGVAEPGPVVGVAVPPRGHVLEARAHDVVADLAVGDVGDVGDHLRGGPPAIFPAGGTNAPTPNGPVEIVPVDPHPRAPNTTKTGTGRGPKRAKRAVDATPAVVADGTPAAGFANTGPHNGKPPQRPRFRLPANAPKLTGAARDAMVAELRGHLRAVAFNARLDHMAGHERDDLAVAEVVALFGDGPEPRGRGP